MDADHYKYSPISSLGQHPEIRIVDLEPGLEHDTIKIQLRQCQLIDSMGSYVALSYTWGNALKTHSARVSSKTLGITQNLHSALVRLRLADKPRSLWIDAICINQEDSTEKSQQIPLMPRIYSSSSSTVVWLGEDSEDLDGQLSFDFFRWAPYLLHTWLTDEIYKLESYDDDDETLMLFFNRGDWRKAAQSPGRQYSNNMLQRFFRRPWFTRRWVIQEVYAAPEVEFVCGSAVISYKELMDFIWDYAQIGSRVDIALPFALLRCRMDFAAKSKGLLGVLDLYHNFRCDDDRDRIAAILGLWATEQAPWSSFHVDYTISVEANYLAFAINMVSTGQCIAILSAALDRQKKTKEDWSLPTWVPDWRLAPHVGSNGIIGERPACLVEVIDDKYLQIEAYREYWFKESLAECEMSDSDNPAHTPQVMDVVYTFFAGGEKFSYVLRPVPDQTSIYTLVCELTEHIWKRWTPYRIRLLKSRNTATKIRIM